MIKLKSLILEYVSNDLIYLKKYLTMSNWEQKIELVNNHPYLIKSFAKQYSDPQIKKYILNNQNEDWEIVEEFKSKFPEEFKDFLDWSYGQLSKNVINPLPTWYVMQYENIVKNQWLIHFSNYSEQIWLDQTFKFGISDLEKLGYTTAYTQESKKHGGFNFAYDIKDYAKYGRGSYRSGTWKYGDEAVLFKASGVKAHHYGDEEPQVIFIGNTAKDIVYLQHINEESEWGVINSKKEKIIYRAQTLPDVVGWVISNFNQYKRVLLP